ncbi:MAG TPA: hypothetical protein GX707_05120 [Epulopiscium sp.]|nr:hypothetical protein [Candidatus Epulonipiscium sp.]
MFCKSIKHKGFWYVLVVVGIMALIVGTIGPKIIPVEQNNVDMLMGMFVGLGSVFTIIGGIKLTYYKKISDEKLKKEEIELHDERNIQVLRAANSVANATATILFATMTFIFAGLNYIVPAFISLGAMTIQQLIFFIAKKLINKKM